MNNELDLEISRVIAVPLDLVWKAWTTPDLLMKWWTPKPWTTSACSMDIRSGGAFKTTMRSPEGVDMPHEGVFLEVVPKEKIVFSDAVDTEYRPVAEPFMTAIITFEDLGDTTRYSAHILHPTSEIRAKHIEMGFYEGWGTVITQLEEVAKTLS